MMSEEAKGEERSGLSDEVPVERLVTVLEEGVTKLSFLDTITPDVLEHREELSKFVGDEIAKIIQEQRRLENKYEKLISERVHLKGMANKSEFKTMQAEIRGVSTALRDSTRIVCRNLQDNPNVAGNLHKVQKERSHLIRTIQSTIEALKSQKKDQVVRTLRSSVLLAREEIEHIRQAVEKEAQVSAVVEALNTDLSKERIEHQDLLQELKCTLNELKHKLHSVKVKTTSNTKFYQREARAKDCAINRIQIQITKKQETKQALLSQQQNTENHVHDATMEFLRSKYANTVAAVETWKNKYDQDFGRVQEEFSRLIQQRAILLDRLAILKQRRQDEIDQEKQHQLRLQEQQKQEQIRSAFLKKQNKAATSIQLSTRAYLARRQEFAAAANKKKAGSGSKQKGKKK